jgi:DNA-binding response OmpR family regulator
MTRNKKVLLVEDETMVSLLLEEMLDSLGYETIGPVATVEAGLAMITKCDVAVLDLNIGNGQNSLPIADRLLETGIPFLFSTGYGEEVFAEKYTRIPKLKKPFSIKSLRAAIELA